MPANLLFGLLRRRELPPAKAMLRLQHYAHEVPSANACNPAAHLINYALHAVTGRMHKSPDLRMRALSSVGALQSLWVGSRANFPGHERMPMRRRRGDVHSDLTAVVIRLIWPGGLSSVSHQWGMMMLNQQYRAAATGSVLV